MAASVGSGIFTEQRQASLRVFLSPSVVHFSSVLGVPLMLLAPFRDLPPLGALVTATGLFGLAYAVLVCRMMIHHHITSTLDLSDRLWYAAIPALGHAVLLAAGVLLIVRHASGSALLAAAMAVLLAAGIRNAWDITSWLVLRPRR